MTVRIVAGGFVSTLRTALSTLSCGFIADVPEPVINRIEVASDVHPGRGDEKLVNAWCVRA